MKEIAYELPIPLPESHTAATLVYETVAAMDECPEGPLAFLHKVRSSVSLGVDPDLGTGRHAYEYYRELPALMERFSEWAREKDFSLVACAPSLRSDAVPILAAIRAVCRDAKDVSRFLYKLPGFCAGVATDFGSVFSALCYLGRRTLDGHNSVLIVDDVLATGNTTAAMVCRLRDAGLPETAKVTIAVPLWIRAPD